MTAGLSNTRLWQACNLKYASHQIMFVHHNAYYDNIIWYRPDSSKQLWHIYKKIFRLLFLYQENVLLHSSYDISCCLQAIATIFNAEPRMQDFFLRSGIKAIEPCLLSTHLHKTIASLWDKIQQGDKNMFDELVQLEFLCPYQIFNSSIVKILWNVCRRSVGQPYAFIPKNQCARYYYQIVDYGQRFQLKTQNDKQNKV